MRQLLAPRNRAHLEALATSRAILAFDFDGTLAPIVPDRDRAAMRVRTRRLFARVCDLYPCAVISGRSRGDVAGRLGEAGVRHVVGNHGIEPGEHIEAYAAALAPVRAHFARAFAGVYGIDVEDKRYSLAVHYRRALHAGRARTLIDRAIAAAPCALRTVAGLFVANVLPLGAPTKGDVLVDLCDREGAERALYVGDDVTDEDVFVLERPEGLVKTRVGRSRSSAARFYLREQREIDVLLASLVELRS
ncbi:MAG: trehalose-phosphatase [Deltaproteobacteria bacterium]|nr:trehalose-phosphatase [Deltaproteobacteria bacterium]MCW5805351.1 trehalose-phosphatase [Deltaproteobacteria bacterium]